MKETALELDLKTLHENEMIILEEILTDENIESLMLEFSTRRC